MRIRINGKSEALTGRNNLAEFIRLKDLKDDSIVVEYNRVIVPMGKWSEVVLKENDVLEIVSFVGGG